MIRKLILLLCLAVLPSVAPAANKPPPGCKVSSGVTECQVTVDSVVSDLNRPGYLITVVLQDNSGAVLLWCDIDCVTPTVGSVVTVRSEGKRATLVWMVADAQSLTGSKERRVHQDCRIMKLYPAG
jgi:hypothetical protein